MEKTIRITKNQGYYLPLFNLKGLKSTITPYFGGDLKIDYHHYALEPVTELDLFKHTMNRNIIFKIDNEIYHLNGQKDIQKNDEVTLKIGKLYQKIIRENKKVKIDTTSFIPVDETLELHKTIIKNKSNHVVKVSIRTQLPIYARSADNLRDHRHVTSLLNRVTAFDDHQGIMVKPTLSFDERGHKVNHHIYSAYAHIEGVHANSLITSMDDFIDGGSLINPLGINHQGINIKQGYESLLGLGFNTFELMPNEEKTILWMLGIHEDEKTLLKDVVKYKNVNTFDDELNKTIDFFDTYLSKLKFDIVNKDVSEQLSWVSLQPMLRRYLGNSYLPHHDYGKGGRGWRDLWQDLLSLIMFNDETVENLLYSNFAGVRIDGSNATIIGDKIGEFKADRNSITRVWSDHGAWPLLTVKMYMDETKQYDFLLKKQTYFDDKFTHYTKQIKNEYNLKHKLLNKLKVYKGTILEHLLLENIVGYFNQGKKGFTKLEDADWNDGLDMASNLGETVAFTHFYAGNLKLLAVMLNNIDQKNISLFKSLVDLIFENITLKQYFDNVSNFNEEVIKVKKEVLINKLLKLYEIKTDHLNSKGFIKTHYQSYVNNDGSFQDNQNSMSLTGQAIALLNKTAPYHYALKIKEKTKKLLFDENLGGYHLNTNYQKVLTNMGRAYGFAYGHKENGAIFNHMSIMYIYGLYNYGFAKEGHLGYTAILNRTLNAESKMLAGIPEYFNDEGVGKYSYLTGSASWMLKLLREQVFGIKLDNGKLLLEPKLINEEFIDNKATITTIINKKKIKITYHNPLNLSYPSYKISKIMVDNEDKPLEHVEELIEVFLDEI